MEETREIVSAQSREISDRSIDTVTDEIITLCHQARSMLTCYIIEIGRRLVEAKGMLAHGEWGTWLSEKVNFSQSTANAYMQIFKEYGSDQISFFGEAKSQTLGNLPYTKALKLLAIPEEEREEFIEANNVEDISTRELDKLIKERDEALKERDSEKARADSMSEAVNELNNYRNQKEALANEITALKDKLAAAKDKEAKAKAQIKELKENPTVPEAVLEKLKSEAEEAAARNAAAELEKQTAEINEKLRALELEKAEAEKREAISAERVSELEKKLKLSSAEVAEFKAIFKTAQETLDKCKASLAKVTAVDPETGAKLNEALYALVERYSKKGA